MRLLVIEDDPKIADFVAKGLRQEGFIVDRSEDGETGLKRLTSEDYAAAIVDLGLPKMDGLSLIEAMRKRNISTPVMILSAKRSVDDRIRGLKAGGDDYLSKPFSFGELLARVQALLRRSREVSQSSELQVGELRLNLVRREAAFGDRKIELLPQEFSLLQLLMRNAGRPVSKALILDGVWGYDFVPETDVVDVLVCRLRKKIGAPAGSPMIETKRGVGYVLKSPVRP